MIDYSRWDLIDQGDESANVFKLAEKPLFFAIQGNHERQPGTGTG
jgi:hypothetical protein